MTKIAVVGSIITDLAVLTPRVPERGENILARHILDRGNTGDQRPPPHQNRAGTAFPLAAAALGARQLKILAQHFEQGPLALRRHGPGLTVHSESDGLCHDVE